MLERDRGRAPRGLATAGSGAGASDRRPARRSDPAVPRRRRSRGRPGSSGRLCLGCRGPGPPGQTWPCPDERRHDQVGNATGRSAPRGRASRPAVRGAGRDGVAPQRRRPGAAGGRDADPVGDEVGADPLADRADDGPAGVRRPARLLAGRGPVVVRDRCRRRCRHRVRRHRRRLPDGEPGGDRRARRSIPRRQPRSP